ncbi:Cloroperoxidase [Xylona heveae TC161]|uniref:Cloroperoxidase n=1 Tax=Xylona heveae (strain CBS 132557 / TC161) TaxID=1328760 RepID=A0A165IG63_XYLHT|nr:Cloroperoxidase [Xylona heveae TC161]KZF24852.1 Cloroperoxidase [Xylona heveae TC161]
MKLLLLLLSASVISVTEVFAFPSIALEAAAKQAQAHTEKKRCPFASKQETKRATPGFDPEAQLIDVSGDHAFVPPNFDAGDLRGPCPGLNALANHNYLPHNGWGTLTDFVTATNEVFGMGIDLATFLSTYGTVMDGNPLALPPGWSIGGVPTNIGILGSLTGLLGTPEGISNSHNKYETDTSPTRGDLYQYGNDYLVQVPQFEALFDLQPDPATANYDLDVLLQHRKNRFQQSINENPYFFNAPFSGLIVAQAAYTFIYRFMGNKSAEYPEGVLNQEVLKSFFSITGEPGNFQYTPGNERIPENWYKRAIGDEYTIAYFVSDAVSYQLAYPPLLSVGGNTGTTNSFTGVDLEDLTAGVYNAQTLAQGDNFACFAFQIAQQVTPDILKGLFSDITDPLNLINQQFNDVLADFTCPQLESVDMSQFNQFPGYTKSGGAV